MHAYVYNSTNRKTLPLFQERKRRWDERLLRKLRHRVHLYFPTQTSSSWKKKIRGTEFFCRECPRNWLLPAYFFLVIPLCFVLSSVVCPRTVAWGCVWFPLGLGSRSWLLCDCLTPGPLHVVGAQKAFNGKRMNESMSPHSTRLLSCVEDRYCGEGKFKRFSENYL